MKKNSHYLFPEWPAPQQVRSAITTRYHGNLATHVGDDSIVVKKNRTKLIEDLQLPNSPLWLEQIHSDQIVFAHEYRNNIQADACIANRSRQVCVVLTADCLPILLCTIDGDQVAAIHAGWRGLVAGIIEKTIQKMNVLSSQLLVWLGPAIGVNAYSIGEDVRQQMLQSCSDWSTAIHFFDNSWHADLATMASIQLRRLGVQQIFGGDQCTYSKPDLYYSYRRQQQTGRFASLIWIEI